MDAGLNTLVMGWSVQQTTMAHIYLHNKPAHIPLTLKVEETIIADIFKSLPCVKHCSKHFVCISSFNLYRSGAVAHTCNPNILGGQGKQMTWAQEFEINLGNIVRPPSLQKKIYKNYTSVVARTCGPSYQGGWGRRITWALEVEVAVSLDCVTAQQPWWQWDPVSRKNK